MVFLKLSWCIICFAVHVLDHPGCTPLYWTCGPIIITLWFNSIFRPVTHWIDCDILLFSSFIKNSRVWTILARHEETHDEHLCFQMDFTRMSQSAALEWIEMPRWSKTNNFTIGRPGLKHFLQIRRYIFTISNKKILWR